MILQKSYEFVRLRSYEYVWISHLVKYVWIAVKSGYGNTSSNMSFMLYDIHFDARSLLRQKHRRFTVVLPITLEKI